MSEDLEAIIREKIDVYGEGKIAKAGKDYSINFMRELRGLKNIRKIFDAWYWDDVTYPNILFRELNDISFQNYVKEQFPYYKEFWKDWI